MDLICEILMYIVYDNNSVQLVKSRSFLMKLYLKTLLIARDNSQMKRCALFCVSSTFKMKIKQYNKPKVKEEHFCKRKRGRVDHIFLAARSNVWLLPVLLFGFHLFYCSMRLLLLLIKKMQGSQKRP